ncbi:MAG TPA: PCRF domain-containing protein, partial [Pseudobdellovibrionaceae bacterium]|nr:PCRF domain-containing protein [Pseudobdellovibrionaceae bacterium]
MNFGGIFDLDQKKKRILELSLQSENPLVWEKPLELQRINKEKSMLEKTVDEFESLFQKVEDAHVLLEMSLEAQDEVSFQEVKTELKSLQDLFRNLEVKRMLSGELDANSTYLSINSGAGGTEACDWAEMLLRMYTRYATQQGFDCQILDSTPGDG